ncbi:addiction module toxin, RelE/StbE family [Campylobacterota bacterium]|nr:addiction module toxin, RelE/StbE family [Campylobacterota bacterium]
MYAVVATSRYRKDYKLAYKRGYDLDLLDWVVEQLADGVELPAQYRDHALSSNWAGYRECHIAPDWILIYKLDNDTLILTLTRTGTHSDLF